MIDTRIFFDNHSDEIYVYVLECLNDGLPVYYLTPDSRIKYKPGEAGTPFFQLNRQLFNVLMPDLMDKLLDFGVKPKEHTITDREWSAQRSHLEDMRKLVGKQLGVDL